MSAGEQLEVMHDVHPGPHMPASGTSNGMHTHPPPGSHTPISPMAEHCCVHCIRLQLPASGIGRLHTQPVGSQTPVAPTPAHC